MDIHNIVHNNETVVDLIFTYFSFGYVGVFLFSE